MVRLASALFVAAVLLQVAQATNEDAAEDKPAVINPEDAPPSFYEAPAATDALFADDFQNGLDKWTHSSVAQYSGRFQVGQGAAPAIPGDQGLIIPYKAMHYAIAAPVDGLSDMSNKDFALSYEVKLDDGMTCSGAYVKMPTTGYPGAAKFKNSIAYSIMFGPDKCGSTEKVHLILQSLNPVSEKYTEHHLTNPPGLATSYDKHHHLYSLYIMKDGSFEVHVDGEKKRHGKLSEDFEPPIQPPKEIEDPDDEKPEDWIDEERIEDPNASKPDDWDENAPEEIPDEDATKPDGWLDDEPDRVPDPEAKKPLEWNDEEDGEWAPPMVVNPKCEKASGCGVWKPPMKENPDYKGKWTAPMIDNPDYVGEWKPRKISNPNYYEVKKPTLLPMYALGLEIWTMDQGILFDDFYVGTDVAAAKRYAKAAFDPKKKASEVKEMEERKKADEEAKAAEDKDSKSRLGRAKKLVRTLESYVDLLEQKLSVLEGLIVKAGFEGMLDKMIDLGISKPMTMVVVTPMAVTLLFLALLVGGRKQPRVVPDGSAVSNVKKTDAPSKDDEPAEKDAPEDGEGVVESESTDLDKSVTRRRRARVE